MTSSVAIDICLGFHWASTLLSNREFQIVDQETIASEPCTHALLSLQGACSPGIKGVASTERVEDNDRQPYCEYGRTTPYKLYNAGGG